RECAQERLERRLALAATEKVAVWRDYHFDESGFGPWLPKPASENCLEMLANLDASQLADGVLANLIGFTDGSVVDHGWRTNPLVVASFFQDKDDAYLAHDPVGLGDNIANDWSSDRRE